MVGRANELGAAGHAVATNLRTIRTRRNFSLRQLQDRLSTLGHSLNYTALSKIEAGNRRADIDDVRALADALDVGVIALMTPTKPERVQSRIDESGYGYSLDVSPSRLIRHDTGDWPMQLPEPLESSVHVEILAEYWALTRPENLKRVEEAQLGHTEESKHDDQVLRHEVLQQAVDAQLDLLHEELQSEIRLWKRISQNPEVLEGTDEGLRLSKLWWRLRKQVQRAEKTVGPHVRHNPTSRARVQSVDDQTLDLITEITSVAGITTRSIEGETVSCYTNGNPVHTYNTRDWLELGEDGEPDDVLKKLYYDHTGEYAQFQREYFENQQE